MSSPHERLRVLVVDDEAPARQRLVDLLHKDVGVAACPKPRTAWMRSR